MLLRNPRVLLVCLGVIIAVLAVVSLRYFSEYQPLSAFTPGGMLDAPQFALEANQVQVVGRSKGKVLWRMKAQTVGLSRDRRTITVSGIRRGTLYGQSGRPGVIVAADRAIYQTPFGTIGPGSAGDLSVSGHVTARVVSAEHLVLRTEQMQWNSAGSTLTCPTSVSAAVPKLTVTAGSAVYTSPPGSPTQGVLGLSGGVQAQFRSSRGQAIFHCPGLSWNAAGQSAHSLGPVSMLIPGGLGTATAADVSVNTHTGDLTSHDLRVTLRVSQEVQ